MDSFLIPIWLIEGCHLIVKANIGDENYLQCTWTAFGCLKKRIFDDVEHIFRLHWLLPYSALVRTGIWKDQADSVNVDSVKSIDSKISIHFQAKLQSFDEQAMLFACLTRDSWHRNSSELYPSKNSPEGRGNGPQSFPDNEWQTHWLVLMTHWWRLKWPGKEWYVGRPDATGLYGQLQLELKLRRNQASLAYRYT